MDIKAYQKKCFNEYKADIGFPATYDYFYGNPINVLVPIEVTTNKVMIVGAYPSAKFYTINGINDVPLYDNDSPFSNESYFDGTRVRNIPSGHELDQMLTKIGVSRTNCWITDLVKVFLFKEGHAERYAKLGKPTTENRTKYVDFAERSKKWLFQEISIAKPLVLITLGAEVASILHAVSKDYATKNLLDGINRSQKIENNDINIISLPHPGILMRNNERNPWPDRFETSIAPRAKDEIKKLLK
jgi:uracil-DNA glycosylase family 4